MFEPSELIRGHLTDKDALIRQTDVPERFQLRPIAVTATREDPDDRSMDIVLQAEAKWIYQNAFLKPAISRQVRDASYTVVFVGAASVGLLRHSEIVSSGIMH